MSNRSKILVSLTIFVVGLVSVFYVLAKIDHSTDESSPLIAGAVRFEEAKAYLNTLQKDQIDRMLMFANSHNGMCSRSVSSAVEKVMTAIPRPTYRQAAKRIWVQLPWDGGWMQPPFEKEAVLLPFLDEGKLRISMISLAAADEPVAIPPEPKVDGS